MALCLLNLGQEAEAAKEVQLMRVDFDLPFYSDFVNFRKWVNRESELFKKEEVFPSRNKLSNFIPKITVRRQGPPQLPPATLKLCIPFPKVEPPEIFPSFDKTLLERLSVLNVERKP